MEYLTLDTLTAYKRPEPLTEDYPLPKLGGSAKVVGLKTYEQTMAVLEEVANLTEQAEAKRLVVVSAATGEKFTPSEEDIRACVWCSACVQEPALTSYQWMCLLATVRGAILQLYVCALKTSRMIEAEKNEDGTPGVPELTDAAKEQLKENPTSAGSLPSA